MTTRPTPDDLIGAIFDEVRACLDAGKRRPAVLGICGAQGSGKTTLARKLVAAAGQSGLAAAALSLDDLYLLRSERMALARDVHPLFATRGPPGTHDLALGLSVLAHLAAGEDTPLPVFDKARDDRAPRSEWFRAPPRCQLLVFEGWCVGALPQDESELATPVNDLERDEDPAGVWRRHANAALAGPYQALFARVDRLVLLAAPDFGVVRDWRLQQEDELRRHGGDRPGRYMEAPAIARFIAHYERITRHILREMPGRADIVATLDSARCINSLRFNPARDESN